MKTQKFKSAKSFINAFNKIKNKKMVVYFGMHSSTSFESSVQINILGNDHNFISISDENNNRCYVDLNAIRTYDRVTYDGTKRIEFSIHVDVDKL